MFLSAQPHTNHGPLGSPVAFVVSVCLYPRRLRACALLQGGGGPPWRSLLVPEYQTGTKPSELRHQHLGGELEKINSFAPLEPQHVQTPEAKSSLKECTETAIATLCHAAVCARWSSYLLH